MGKTQSQQLQSVEVELDDQVPLGADDIREQDRLGAQSTRGRRDISFGVLINLDRHAVRCFQQMLENERFHCGEWAVFYHLYSCAALLYELQAAIAAVLSGFESSHSPLPRLKHSGFADIPDARVLRTQLPTWRELDHDARFRSVGICANTSLLACQEEAAPCLHFFSGYSVGKLSISSIEGLLMDSCVPAKEASLLAAQMVGLGGEYGLNASAFGGRARDQLSGHLLQIFMKRHLVDKYAYASLSFGSPDLSRHPIGKHLLTCGLPRWHTGGGPSIAGQVRIVAHPHAFQDASKVKMYAYSANESFHEKRVAFQKELVKLLEPVLPPAASKL